MEGEIVGRWKEETSGLYDCLRQGQKQPEVKVADWAEEEENEGQE